LFFSIADKIPRRVIKPRSFGKTGYFVAASSQNEMMQFAILKDLTPTLAASML